MIEIKVCHSCKRTLRAVDFSRNAARRDGLQDECRRCRSDRRRTAHAKGADQTPDSFWTPDRQAQIVYLWAIDPPLSARDIAVEIGCSRNAVLGRRFRTRLPSRIKTDSNGGRQHPLDRLQANQCHFPIGLPFDPGFRYCAGNVSRPGASYCDHHRAIMYVKPKADVQEAAD